MNELATEHYRALKVCQVTPLPPILRSKSKTILMIFRHFGTSTSILYASTVAQRKLGQALNKSGTMKRQRALSMQLPSVATTVGGLLGKQSRFNANKWLHQKRVIENRAIVLFGFASKWGERGLDAFLPHQLWKASYSCRIGLASNLAFSLGRKLPTHMWT